MGGAMKINTEVKEGQSGLVFKKKTYTVVLEVLFSEEEKAQISMLGLTKDFDKNVLVGNLRGPTSIVAIDRLMKEPFHYLVDDLPHAKDFESTAIKALKDLKEYLTANTDTGKKSIEL
jgi:hypothetical protein